ncbi:hypothetical protein ACOSQ2_021168 [Xanthoceras sorbifolium]
MRKGYKKKHIDNAPGKQPKEKYNLYGFDVVHEQLEPYDIKVTRSYYEGLEDILDLFPHNVAIPSS